MRKSLFIAIGIIMLAFASTWAVRSTQPPSENQGHDLKAAQSKEAETKGIRLFPCDEDLLGISFLCDYAWKDQDHSDNAIFYRISSDPLATLKIAKFDTAISYIEQLSRDRLEGFSRYHEGFRVEDTMVAGYKAIMVKAFAKDDPQTRRTDYYFIRNNSLYVIMFSVSPKGQWDHYKFAFQKIVTSFEFLQYESETN